MEKDDASSIVSFYRDKTVFITGCTGFLGIVVVEKLLRSLPDVKKIILLIRPIRGKSPEERIKKYVKDEVFSRLDSNIFEKKVQWVVGDVCKENLGLSVGDMNTIIDSVNVVFHCAATVRFNEPLKTALTVNLKGTDEVLKLASKIKNLQSFMFVSTAYSNCPQTVIEETLYENKIRPECLLRLIDDLDEDLLDGITPAILQQWPNTYTFSKNVTENLVANYKHRFPIGIFRPGALIASYQEPFPSWLNKGIATNFVVIAAGIGLLKIFAANNKGNTCLIPVDMTANALIACAWDVSQKREIDLKIYNYTSYDNPLLSDNYIRYSLKLIAETPYECALGYPSCKIIPNVWMVKVLTWFLHILPAHCMDFAMKLAGKKPIYIPMYMKLHRSLDQLHYFMGTIKWKFKSENIFDLCSRLSQREKDLFYFDVRTLDWEKCLSTTPIGIKRFFLKEDLSQANLARAKRRYRMFSSVRTVFQLIVIVFAIYVFRNFVTILF